MNIHRQVDLNKEFGTKWNNCSGKISWAVLLSRFSIRPRLFDISK